MSSDTPSAAAAASSESIAAALHYARSNPPSLPLPLGVYQHYKNKQLYLVRGVARHTEREGEAMVIYRALYDSPGNPQNWDWARPLDMFTEEVEYEGKRVKRFTLVASEEEVDRLEKEAAAAAAAALAAAAPKP